MGGKTVLIALLTLLGLVLMVPCASAEVFKWVDDKGTVHFTEDESAIPERYRGQAEKRTPREETMPPKVKGVAEKPKKRATEQPPKESEGKQGINVRRIESDVADFFDSILTLWKEKKYDALYEYGDLKSCTQVAKEDFGRRMEQKAWEPALSWERVRDVEVEVKSATLAYVKARIGYRPKQGGETRIRTETHEMRLEKGAWRINLMKVLRSPK